MVHNLRIRRGSSHPGENGQPTPSRLARLAIPAAWMALALLWAGCGGSSGGAPATAKAIPATNSSIIAVDCKRQLAFIPLNFVNDQVHGQVAVMDLSVDPDVANPLLTVLDIGLIALPRSAAVDIDSGTVMVLADNAVGDGTMLLINESDFSMTTVSFPAGSRPDALAGVVFNPADNTALVSMVDADDCMAGAGGCTGESIFDLNTQTFGPLVVTFFGIDNFALQPKTNLNVGTTDGLGTELLAPFINQPQTLCTFDDDNIHALNADPDGMGTDPTTNIWVVGNYESSTATIVNLNRSSYSGVGTNDCSLNEGGTPPNSVNFDSGAGATGMPGVAVNPVTHKALLTAVSSNQIALLSLPTHKVKQLTASKVSAVASQLPNDPNGNVFDAAEFPYGNAIDTCHNLGYVIDDLRTFLTQIDLKTLQKDSTAISTALPSGTCAGVATTFQCDNGNGVKFFPLPTPGSSSQTALPGQLNAANQAFNELKAAKHRR